MWLLEINDQLIRLWKDGQQCFAEPGIAQVDRNSVIFGHEASGGAFTHPVQTLSSYWQRLNEEPSEQRNKAVSKQSDLVFNQLNKVFEDHSLAPDDGLWVALASDIDAQQAGLLYGILQYKELPIRGFVDMASSVATIDYLSGDLCFIDMHLHRSVVTEVSVSGDRIEIESSRTLAQLGYMQLMNRWINTVSEKSLDENRFDPRVSGQTEQQVFNQLQERVASADESILFEISHNEESRSINVPRADLVNDSLDFYERLLASCSNISHVVLGEHTASLPGLEPLIQSRNLIVDYCTGHSLNGVVSQLESTRSADADVTFVKSYSRQSSSQIDSSVQTQVTQNNAPSPTHVLANDIARPLANGSEFRIDGTAIGSLQQQDGQLRLSPSKGIALSLNDAPISRETVVNIGDQLTVTVDGETTQSARLIFVVDSG